MMSAEFCIGQIARLHCPDVPEADGCRVWITGFGPTGLIQAQLLEPSHTEIRIGVMSVLPERLAPDPVSFYSSLDRAVELYARAKKIKTENLRVDLRRVKDGDNEALWRACLIRDSLYVFHAKAPGIHEAIDALLDFVKKEVSNEYDSSR